MDNAASPVEQHEAAPAEGCTPEDARMLRAANHSLAVENEALRRALRPFARIVSTDRLSWAIVEYCIDGDPEKQTFQRPQMQRAFNRVADLLRENVPNGIPSDINPDDLPDWVKNGKPPAQPESPTQPAPSAPLEGTGNGADERAMRVTDGLEACDWSGVSIGNKAIIKYAVELLRNRVLRNEDVGTVAADRAFPAKNGYFVYDPEGNGFDLYDTDAERAKAHNTAIEECRRAAIDDGEWPLEVDSIVSGVVTHKTAATNVDGDSCEYAAAPSADAAAAPADERAAFEVYMRARHPHVELYRRDVRSSSRFGQYCREFAQEMWGLWQARAAASQPAAEPIIPAELHHDTAKLVRRFARALANKLLSAQRKYGYSDNWMRDDWADECRAELMRHIQKGDPRDVAAYCAFLWHHNESTAAAAGQEAVAWVRKHPDTGELSGDWLWNDAIEQCRKNSGVWFPLGFLTAAPAQVVTRQGLTDEQWYDLASRHANAEWNGDGYLASVKALCDDYRALLAAQQPEPRAEVTDDEYCPNCNCQRDGHAPCVFAQDEAKRRAKLAPIEAGRAGDEK